MEIRSLRYFLAVAEEQSFSRAAEKLNIAQPAVSRQLQALEQEFGHALIERNPKGAKLTAFGMQFYPRFRRLVDDLDQLLAEAKGFRGRKVVPLNIGLPPTSAEEFGAALLDIAERHKPRIELVFVEGLSRFLNEWLSEKRIDLAILTDRQDDVGLDYTFLAQEDLCLLLPLAHPFAQGDKPVPLAALDGEPLILSTVFYRILREHAARLGINVHCALSIDSVSAARQIMHDTTRASMLPRGVAAREAYDPRFVVRDLEHPPQRPLFLGVRRGESRPELLAIARALTEKLERLTKPVLMR